MIVKKRHITASIKRNRAHTLLAHSHVHTRTYRLSKSRILHTHVSLIVKLMHTVIAVVAPAAEVLALLEIVSAA